MLNIKKEDFEQLEILANEEFDLKHSILQAKDSLSRYSNENKFNHCEFNEDIWILHDETDKTNRYINYDSLSEILLTRTKYDLKTIMKCWAATLIDKGLSAGTITSKVNGLLQVVTISNGFSKNFFDSSIEYIEKSTSRPRLSLCNAVLNFFDYFPYADEEGIYTEKIWEIKSRS